MRVLPVLLALVLLAGCVKTKDATGTDGTADDAPPRDDGTPTPSPEVALAVAAPQIPPYSFAPNALRAKAGETVNVTFTNQDAAMPHDWVFDEAKANTDVLGGGESASVVFIAPAAGTYTFYCSVGQHRQLGMTGTFTVE